VEKQRFNRILRGFFQLGAQKGTNHARFPARATPEPPAKRFGKGADWGSERPPAAPAKPFFDEVTASRLSELRIDESRRQKLSA
jgi:hypothetical protein